MERRMRMFAIAVVLVSALGTAANAQLNPLTYYLGVGYAKETNSGAPSGSLGLLAGANVSVLTLRVGAEVGYDLLGSSTIGNTKYSPSLIPVSAQIYYGLPLAGSPIKPWLTVGAGPYTQRLEIDQNGDKVTLNGTKLGFNVGVGGDIAPPASGLKLGVDLRFHVIGKDSTVLTTESTKVITLLARLYL